MCVRLVPFASDVQMVLMIGADDNKHFTSVFSYSPEDHQPMDTDRHIHTCVRIECVHRFFSSCFYTNESACSCTLTHMQTQRDKVASSMSWKWRWCGTLHTFPTETQHTESKRETEHLVWLYSVIYLFSKLQRWSHKNKKDRLVSHNCCIPI